MLSHITLTARDGISLSGTAVIALGTFDGVHIAHRALIKKAVELKERLGAALVGVWCFDKTPAAFLRGESIMTLSESGEKAVALLDAGADVVITADFEYYRGVCAEDFVNDILKTQLDCIGAVCGFDHRFGHRGLGSTSLLEELFGKENTAVLPKIVLDGETVSSSAIRSHLMRGEVEPANAMLGRALSFTSTVTEGKRLGRALGFPTANQRVTGGLSKLRYGVYATRCRIGEESYIGVSNIGTRPSIDRGDDHELNCETHLLGFSGELYGKEMTVELCSFLRDEQAFSSLDELRAAIGHDKAAVENYFK